MLYYRGGSRKGVVPACRTERQFPGYWSTNRLIEKGRGLLAGLRQRVEQVWVWVEKGRGLLAGLKCDDEETVAVPLGV
jgi:hypothetical protein